LGSLLSMDWGPPWEREASDSFPCDGVTADGFLPERSIIQVHIDLFDVPLVPFQKSYLSSSKRESASCFNLSVLSYHKAGEQSMEWWCFQSTATEMFWRTLKGLQCNLFSFSGPLAWGWM
ncbi:hypothetical protein BAE44_0012735, partial [Dichanthelium oligosanthes]